MADRLEHRTLVGDVLHYKGFAVVDLSTLNHFSSSEKDQIKDMWTELRPADPLEIEDAINEGFDQGKEEGLEEARDDEVKNIEKAIIKDRAFVIEELQALIKDLQV